MNNHYLLFILLLCLFSSLKDVHCEDCDKKYYGYGSFTCVCRNDRCASPGEITPPSPGTYKSVTSSKEEHRFYVTSGNILKQSNDDIKATVINIDVTEKYQKILGFGAAFTDASGMNVLKLPLKAEKSLFRDYFSEEGIKYNLARVPIAGCDFSVRAYSYADEGEDSSLQQFSLQPEDHHYKIPYLKKALNITGDSLKIFASPWSPPAWMKDNGQLHGAGEVKKEMYGTWASYIVRFLEEYKKKGIKLWGINTQNHPLITQDDWRWNSCYWSPKNMRDWVVGHLGPQMRDGGFQDVKIMLGDENRGSLPWYPQQVLSSQEALDFIDGINVHWYEDFTTSPELLEDTHNILQDKFILYTEACEGYQSDQESIKLGDWNRAETYATSIIEALNHWSVGWVDWNMALDTLGGPNWAGNTVDAPVIIDTEKGFYLKQPMFYAIGHFSKFIMEGSTRVKNLILKDQRDQCSSSNSNNKDGCSDSDSKTPTISSSTTTILASSFLHADNKTVVVVILNKGNVEESVVIKDVYSGQLIQITCSRRSITTVLYNT